MIKKIIIVITLMLILASCSNIDPVTVEEAQPNQQSKVASEEYEKINADNPLPEEFPIVESAILVEYFDFYGMYQYTYASHKEDQEIIDKLITGLEEIGIMATCHSTSEFSKPPSKDIVMVDGSNQGGIGYIIVHPEGASDYGDVPGYTVVASEILFEYEPIKIEEIDVDYPDNLPIYPGAILVEFQDNSEEFIPTLKYTYFVKINCFSSMDETELMLPEIREIYDYYLQYFKEQDFDYDLYPHEIDAIKRNENIVVTINPYDISGVIVGGEIEVEIEQ